MKNNNEKIIANVTKDAMFEPVLVADAMKENIVGSLIESAIFIVLSNTARITKVSPEATNNLINELLEFKNAKKIVINTYRINGPLLRSDEFKFDIERNCSFKSWVRSMSTLINFLVQNDIWYEDKLNNGGFCCHHPISGRKEYFTISINK